MTEQWNAAEGHPEGHGGGGLDIGALVHSVTELQKQVAELTGTIVGGAAQVTGQSVADVGGIVADVPGLAPAGGVVSDVGQGVAGAGTIVSAISGGTTLEPESGSTTSEFKVVLAAIVSILGMFGVTLGSGVVNILTIVGPICLTVLAAVFAWVRSNRKNVATKSAVAVAQAQVAAAVGSSTKGA